VNKIASPPVYDTVASVEMPDITSYTRRPKVNAFAVAVSALALGATIGAATAGQSLAAEPEAAPGSPMQYPRYAAAGAAPATTAGILPVSQFSPLLANRDVLVAEGAPCAPTMRDGKTPHFTWKAGYVQKARWEYHWACEL
jgi:hypothetical protein